MARAACGASRRAEERYTATYFVPAWGQLNQPSIPAFPGLETYRGASFHSARWNGAVELRGSAWPPSEMPRRRCSTCPRSRPKWRT